MADQDIRQESTIKSTNQRINFVSWNFFFPAAAAIRNLVEIEMKRLQTQLLWTGNFPIQLFTLVYEIIL